MSKEEVKATEYKKYYNWCKQVQYGLVCAGVFPTANYSHTIKKIDQESWKHFYDDGCTALEAVYIDLTES